MTKKIVLEFIFDEKVDSVWPDYTELVLGEINVVESTLTEGERSGLGEEIAQTDEWQVNRWINIQNALGGTDRQNLR